MSKSQFVVRHASFAIFLAFLALYIVTLLPDVLPADSGEFQFVCAAAGVAHPPGYPLYTMLGWLFAHLPLGPSPAWRVNFFSAVTAAATVALVFRTARHLTGSVWGGLAAALTLGSATTFWATATTASIRLLVAFFTVLSLYALTQYAIRNTPTGYANDRHLIVFAAALSLGLTHHASLIFPASIFIIYLVLVDPALLRQPRRWCKPVAVFALGLLVLIYLPLRGSPELATLPGFLEHVLALGFRGDMFALNLFDRLVLLPTLLRFQFNPMLLLAALVGVLLLLWRDRKLAFLLFGSFLVHTAVNLTYDAPQTVEYEIPAYVSLALLVAVPFGEISNLKSKISNHLPSFIVHCSLFIFLIAGVVNLIAHFPSYRALSTSRDARVYAETLLCEAPADAVILLNWHWFTPMRYVQRVEGLRPDLLIKYVAPSGKSLAQTWVSKIEEYVPQGPVVIVNYFEQEYTGLPYRFEPLGEAFLVRTEPAVASPSGLTLLDVTMDEQIALLGYRLEADKTEPARPLVLALALSPIVTPTADVALFAHLIGPDGRLWSVTQDPRHPATRLTRGEIVTERFVIYPLLHAPPGEYTLVVGAYLPDGRRLTTADGADAVPLTTVHLQPSTTRPVTRHPRFARLAGGPTLIGADYDTGVPDQMRVYLHWAGPGAEATVQLLDESSAVLGQSQVPALERGQYTTIAFDLPVAPARVALLNGDHPRRWNVLFDGLIPLRSPAPGERYVPFGDALVLTSLDGPVRELEPGADVTLGLHFLGARPLERDYIVSVSLAGLDADDKVPALGAIPTFKWIRNSAIFDPHRLTIPDDALPGPVVGSLVVYDHFTQAPLLALDERFGPDVPLGAWTIASP
jgi:hypothetical protein